MPLGNFWSVLSDAVSSILSDKYFQIATAVVETARKVSAYIKEEVNRESVKKYSADFFSMLVSCLNSKYKCRDYKWYKMWLKYHQLRTSAKYTKLWSKFVTEATGSSGDAQPMFYRNQLFHALIKEYYIDNSDDASIAVKPLTYQEVNVLRYVAGHVC